MTDFPILSNRVYLTREEAMSCPRGDIRIIEDKKTGLIYNDAFCSDLMSYDTNYDNEQSNSPYFQKHLETVKDIISTELGNHSLVEVGCGKGFFLEMLQAQGFDVLGLDPTYEGDNPKIVKEYFKPGVIQPARGFILRHVLEHVVDPYRFLCDLRDGNGGQGLIYIEVPCFDWICKKRNWCDIFYEHVNYFRMNDFLKMFTNIQTNGTLFGGQYLFIVANLANLKSPKYEKKDTTRFPIDFLDNLSDLKGKKTAPTIVWGAGSKGCIFSLIKERMGEPVSAVVDINPKKQGKFLPATGLKVLSPETFLSQYPEGTTLYVMNSNYTDEIRAMSMNRYKYITVN
jgi:hypothetical protein